MIRAAASSSITNLYWFQSALITPVFRPTASLADQQSYSIWHQHFGHLSYNVLCHTHMQLSNVPLLENLPIYPPCAGCALGKMPDCSFPGSSKWTSSPLALVHTDLIGPMLIELHSCTSYILTFIDNHMGYTLLAFLWVKSDVKKHFRNMVSWAETFTGHHLASLHLDQGGEFMSHEFQVFLSSKGVTHQTSIPHMS